TDSPRPEQMRRLLFEIICFALFIIMAQEVPKHIRHLRGDEPDAATVRGLNTALFERARRGLEELAAGLHEIELGGVNPMTFVEGQRLDARRRLAEHFKAGTTAAAEQFAFLGALSIDVQRAGIITPIVLRLVEAVVEVCRIVLQAAFETKPDASTRND